MSRWNLSWLLSFTAITLLGLSITFSAPSRGTGLQKAHEHLKLVVDVYEEVRQKYVKEASDDDMRQFVEDMVQFALERKDPYSGYLNPEELKQFKKQSQGRFGGIGIRISVDRAGQIFVESPMPGTPAYEAGVLAGDLILKVEGESTESMSLKKAVEMIQGEPGTKVKLNVLHEGSKTPVDIDITRAEIAIDSIMGDQRQADNLKEWNYWIDPVSKIAYVRIIAFTETTVPELLKVLDTLQKQNMNGLVIDLRNNPGGLLRAAVEVSSMFLPEGKTIVTTKGRNNQKEEVFNAHHEHLKNLNPGLNYPICVLINRYSASASEILAAALQDHLRAIIIGERSFGKGSVQNIIPLENGSSALKLTTASYWRPSGRNIHRFAKSKEDEEWGVKPDIEVKLSDEERIEYYKWRRDRDVVRRPGDPAPKVKEDEKKKEPFKDRVLEKAVEEIHKQLKKKNGNAQAPAAPPAVVPESEASVDAAQAPVLRREEIFAPSFRRHSAA